MLANRRGLIRFAEYAAVSASVMGAIATITTGKPAYAALPLSISAALSLVSRHQRSQQLEQATSDVTQSVVKLELTEQQATQRLEIVEQQSLRHQKRVDSLNETIAQRGNDIATATKTIAAIEADAKQQRQQLLDQSSDSQLADLFQQISQLKIKLENRIAHLSQYVTQANQSTDQQQDFSAQQIAQLENRVTQTYEQFERLRIDINALVLQFQQQSDGRAGDAKAEETDTAIALDFSDIIPQLPTEDNFDGDINLGIDFGTGYTKVCFRDLARDKSEVVTFATLTGETLRLEETLMPTRLAILKDGTLLTGLTEDEWDQNNQPIEKQIDYIKMRLAAIDMPQNDQEDAWRLEQIPELDDDQTVESLCAYYLSQVIVRSQQWIIQNKPELFANQTVRWSVNIGVPVEYCDSDALQRFEKVLALAWLLKSSEVNTATLTIDSLNQLIAHLQQWMDQNKKREELDCFTTPEIVAAMWSFINSRQAQEGFYTFFDIGDGTLDGAAFIFNRSDGDRQVDCYIGQVEPLGVSAFVEKTASELSLSPTDVRQSLSEKMDVKSNTALQAQMQQSATRKKVQRMVANIVMSGNEKHGQIRQFSVKKDVGENLKVFVGGGGSNTEFFRNTIQATHTDFQQINADIPPYELRDIPTPSDLVVNGVEDKDFNRFAIAYGLSIPKEEGPEINLPSQFDHIESGSEISDYYEPDRYEDGKDAM